MMNEMNEICVARDQKVIACSDAYQDFLHLRWLAHS